ncbi:MAG: lytic transglycosylase [Novosphingobium sp. PASSN1]|nr:MAG: lytic transglycosylase [Novosphingobium sp. PASSN1]
MSVPRLLLVMLVAVRLLSHAAIAAEATSSAGANATPAPVEVSTKLGPAGFSLVTFWNRGAEPIERCNGGCTATQSTGMVRGAKAVPASNFRRASYLRHVRSAERRYALPLGLLDAVIWIESRYNPFALSKAGAAGLGQLMPKTAHALGVANRYDPLTNIEGSAQYLHEMLNQFGTVHLAIAAYNAGPKAVRTARGIPDNGETLEYVHQVVTAWRNNLD